MTVNVSKPALNVREKLAELDKPTGIAGEAMLRAETPQEQFNLIGAGRRNIIINGDMRIDQRNGGSAIIGHQKYGVDRFQTQTSQGGTVSQRVADAPDGFYYSLKLTNGGNDNVGTTYREVRYAIEGHDLAGWDKDNQSLTLSFWVKSSLAGTYQTLLRTDSGTDYFFGISYTLQANTWTKVERTIPPNPLSTLSSDNLAGMNIFFVPYYGTNYTSAASGLWSTSYSSVLDNYPQNWANTSNATFNITGVQLELGKVATPFEHRSYGEELALCKRYFYRHNIVSNRPVMGALSYVENGTQTRGPIQFPVEMRSSPTLTVDSGTYNFVNGTTSIGVSLSLQSASPQVALIYGSGSGLTTGAVGYIRPTTDASISFDAEL